MTTGDILLLTEITKIAIAVMVGAILITTPLAICLIISLFRKSDEDNKKGS